MLSKEVYFMIGLLLKRAAGSFGWEAFTVGAVAAVAARPLVRPALVTLVKAGMTAQETIADVVQKTQVEMAAVRAEQAAVQEEMAARQAAADAAAGVPSQADLSALLAELQALRAEVAQIRSSTTDTHTSEQL